MASPYSLANVERSLLRRIQVDLREPALLLPAQMDIRITVRSTILAKNPTRRTLAGTSGKAMMTRRITSLKVQTRRLVRTTPLRMVKLQVSL